MKPKQPPADRTELLQETLGMLILPYDPVGLGSRTRTKYIQRTSDDPLQVEHGSLYPALHRLEQQAWLKAEWRPTETGRMAEFYSPTRSARKQMKRELANWVPLSTAINIVVQEAQQYGF